MPGTRLDEQQEKKLLAENQILKRAFKVQQKQLIAAKQESENEYRRLLYVAMTRAADRLIVGGSRPGKGIAPLSWYELIQNGLVNSDLAKQELKTGFGTVTRFTRKGDIEPTAPAALQYREPQLDLSPAWLRTPAPFKEHADILLRPSDPADDDVQSTVTAESLAVRAKALQRGTLVHRLLQSLPDVAAARRSETAKTFLVRNAKHWSEGERDVVAKQVTTIIANERFAPLFAQGSRAEVSIVGRVARKGKPPALVSGQIDRLVVTPDEILIVDYKTNHAPPASVADAPPPYVRQLALYRDVLARLYPGKPVRCMLLWTETASIMEIPASALDAGLQSIVG